MAPADVAEMASIFEAFLAAQPVQHAPGIGAVRAAALQGEADGAGFSVGLGHGRLLCTGVRPLLTECAHHRHPRRPDACPARRPCLRPAQLNHRLSVGAQGDGRARGEWRLGKCAVYAGGRDGARGRRGRAAEAAGGADALAGPRRARLPAFRQLRRLHAAAHGACALCRVQARADNPYPECPGT